MSGMNIFNQDRSPGLLKAALALFLLGCLLYALLFAYHGARQVMFPYDIDNSEGFLLYQAMRLAEGEFLYPPLAEAPYLVDNYPPVYPLLSAIVVKWTGPAFFWPRLLSFLATLGTACVLALWVKTLTQNRWAAVAAALVYLSFYHVYQWGALARVDALGVFFAVWALLRAERSGAGNSALGLLLLALFTRHSLLAAPLAVIAWLWQAQGWRAALRFGAALAISGVVLLGGLALFSDGRVFWHLVVYNINLFSLTDVWLNFRHWFLFYSVWGAMPFALVLLGSRLSGLQGQSQGGLLVWFSLFAIGEALLCGKIGSAPNYFLPLAAAASAGVGIWLAHAWRAAWSVSSDKRDPLPMAIFVAAGIIQLVATVHWPHTSVDFAETPTRTQTQAGRFIERDLRGIEGPVFADLAGIALRAGHNPSAQPFICTQLAREGKWAPQPFLDDLRTGAFQAVLFHFDVHSPNWDRRRFLPEMIEAVRHNYQLRNQVGRYYLYEPIPAN